MTAYGPLTPHWLATDDAGGSPSPTELRKSTEVVIVGGGLMGVSVAYWLARLGDDVVLAEVDRLAGMASGRNAGLMLPGRGTLEDPTLVRSVLHDEAIEAEWETPGHLTLADSAEIWERIEEEATRQPEPGRVQALDRAACETLLGMRVNSRYFGGRWFPGGGVLHPLRLVHGLADAARRHGAQIATETAVLRVSPDVSGGGHEVVTSRGRIKADHVVWACGAAFRCFHREFERSTSLARGQMLATTPLPPLFRTGMAVDWGTVYWRQATDGAILLGGCRSLDLEFETGPGQYVNNRIQSELAKFLPEAFPGFPPFRVARRWAGVMDYTSDGRPLIGPVPENPGQWVIAGFGGHGLPPALGAGRALATAIVTGRAPDELDPYDPARLLKERTPC